MKRNRQLCGDSACKPTRVRRNGFGCVTALRAYLCSCGFGPHASSCGPGSIDRDTLNAIIDAATVALGPDEHDIRAVHRDAERYFGVRAARWSFDLRRRSPLSLKIRFAVLKRDGFRCVYCGTAAADAALEVDHVIAVANGGTDDPANLATACFDCNRGKRDRPL